MTDERMAALGRIGAARRGTAEMARVGRLGNPRKYRRCRSRRNKRRSHAHQFRRDRCAYCRKTRDDLRLPASPSVSKAAL